MVGSSSYALSVTLIDQLHARVLLKVVKDLQFAINMEYLKHLSLYILEPLNSVSLKKLKLYPCGKVGLD